MKGKISPATNSCFAKAGVSYLFDSEVSVTRSHFAGSIPHTMDGA
jgi:hypothetical protein